MFVDKAKIFVTAGRGGDGCISFRREKYVPFGGPDGGNAGKGGDVYLESDPHLQTLLDFTYKPHFLALSGAKGGANNRFGRCADDLIIKVPAGTIVKKDGKMIFDFKEPGQKFLVAKGGRGGRGNSSFKTSRRTAPRIAEKGEPGEVVTLELELRLIADVGLVGLPNAGKSTFLSRVSSAKPKIADYPFTTLAPNLGVTHFQGKGFVIADIPGLIEGAHEGKGLGDEFLRHVRRTKVLIHIIDIYGYDDKPAWRNFKTINNELAKHSKTLAARPMVIVANKMDLTDSKKLLADLRKRLKNKKIYPISAVTGEGVNEVLSEVIKQLAKPLKEEALDKEFIKEYIYEPEFMVERREDYFEVTGRKVERLASMTDFEVLESLWRFQNILKKMGVEKALKEKGIKEGDLVKVGKTEFTFEE